MTDERDKMLKVLQDIIEMEQDVKDFYLNALKSINNLFTRELIDVLAQEEEIHRDNIAVIHKALRDHKKWPDMSKKPVSKRNLKDLLNTTCRAIGIAGASNAIPAHILQAAIEKEENSYNLYNEKAKRSNSESEKSFYTKLAVEEKEHFLTLVDFKQYLEDPETWLSEHERWGMEG